MKRRHRSCWPTDWYCRVPLDGQSGWCTRSTVTPRPPARSTGPSVAIEVLSYAHRYLCSHARTHSSIQEERKRDRFQNIVIIRSVVHGRAFSYHNVLCTVLIECTQCCHTFIVGYIYCEFVDCDSDFIVVFFFCGTAKKYVIIKCYKYFGERITVVL